MARRPGLGEIALGAALGFAVWWLAYYVTVEVVGNIRPTAVVALIGFLALRRARARAVVHRACPHCLSAIPADASVCAHCTRDL